MTPPLYSPVQNPKNKMTLFLALLLGIVLGLMSHPLKAYSHETQVNQEDTDMVASPAGEDNLDDSEANEDLDATKSGTLCHKSHPGRHHHHHYYHHHHHHHLHHCHQGPQGSLTFPATLYEGEDDSADAVTSDNVNLDLAPQQ